MSLRPIVLPLLLLLATPAAATDGVIELNQSCALNTGCLPGDAPGYPITITAAGSFRLTGRLNLRTPPILETAIAVTAGGVTIDLNGFEIIGPGNCTGFGETLSCDSALGGFDGHGIHAPNNDEITVRNGMVHNMRGYGIYLDDSGRVSDVQVRRNSLSGIRLQDDGVITGCVATQNAEDGFMVNTGSVVHASASSSNGSDGLYAFGADVVVTSTSLRDNGEQSLRHVDRLTQQAVSCDDDHCSRRGARRYYLSATSVTGELVASHCDSGFHLATSFELWDPSDMQYDRSRGLTTNESGPAVSTRGWIVESGWALAPDCSDWTTPSSSIEGTTLSIRRVGAQEQNPGWLVVSTRACDLPHPVWCVED